ncbi:peptidase S10 [Nitrospirillum sp. BR 11752]|uniref:S10 family peptidase n=1 Tax=Nitrospirillum sp. BR 11752 TaxID=3104293 RepID=UPI002EC9E054|nr:peptidase S10 [Nitrospirillum sp. BR 11752]
MPTPKWKLAALLTGTALILLTTHMAITSTPANAGDKPAADQAKGDDKAGGDKSGADKDWTPKHFTIDRSGTFNGKRVDYQVLAGETHLVNDKEEDAATVFSTAYVKKGVKDATQRPLIFLFNGGPGSASLWLHMGAWGPKRVDVPSDATNAGSPPYPLKDNPQSLLDVADLVFIDPVGTGYSRILPKGDEKDYYGVKQDAHSIAQFMRRWLTDHKRWNSPVFIGGESYGGMRIGALLPELLENGAPVGLNGLIVVSGAVDYGAFEFNRGNDVPYPAFLPTYAAVAWYHKKIADTSMGFDAFMNQVRKFAVEEYPVALLKGNRMSPAERKGVIDKLSRFTGLSPAYLDRTNLRVRDVRFAKELLRDQGKVVGIYDGRYTGQEYDSAGDTVDSDPSGYGVGAAFATTLQSYLLSDLNIKMDREYRTSGDVGKTWDWKTWGDEGGGYANVAPWYGDAMRQNPKLKVFMAGGWYDICVPFFSNENAMNANGVPTDRVTFSYYEAGHMMYLNRAALDKLTDDVRHFVRAAAPGAAE